MSWVEDKLTEQFYRWELRGRGWQIFPHPVSVEPPFRPFTGHFVPPRPIRDEGQRHTFLSRLFENSGNAFLVEDEASGVVTGPEEEEPKPKSWERQSTVESQIILPRERKYPPQLFESLLLSLSSCCEPVAFEVLGTSEATVLQFASHPRDAPLLRRQVQGRIAGVTISESQDLVSGAWSSAAPSFAIAEFGLECEFMLTLDAAGEWQASLFAALSDLAEGELGLLQVIFDPVRQRWAESALLAVTDGEGGPFFVNRPELAEEAAEKFGRPLSAVVLRVAACADDPDRAWRIIGEMAGGLRALAKPGGNNFVPLANTGYDTHDHEEDLLRRQSRRTGMLLNMEELAALVRFPDSSLHTPKLRQDTGRTRAMPSSPVDGSIVLGENVHAGITKSVTLSLDHRVRHIHILGASGTGKTTFLFNLIRQDILSGAGLALLDPHGDLVERILGIIPSERLEDVILVDPSDEEYSVGFNILSAHSDFEKTLLASDLVSVFQRLSTSWGDQMASVLNNAILAFLESTEGGTLADLRKFLLDAAWRKQFLRTVKDADIVYYWEKGFPQLGGNKSIGPVLTRLESFLAPKPIRYMVSQRSNRLDFADITDSGKIFLAKLPQGQMGRENAWLLGSLLVSKFQQTAMARQRVRVEERRPFWLYVDEFQNFMTPSMAEILTGARKYRLGLILAHQDLNQLRREADIASAVLSNACTRVVFRVSDSDAKTLENGFAHFTARELQNLNIGEAICRIERSDADFNLSISDSAGRADPQAACTRESVVALSRERYGTPRSQIESDLIGTPKEKDVGDEQDDEARSSAPMSLVDSEAVKAQLTALREELRKVVRPAPSTEPVSAPKAPPDLPPALGKGGEIHQTTQLEIKRLAEGLGFRATIEKQLPGTLESTDVLLERDGRTIAVEITVTTSLDDELKNIGKCLRAGVSEIAMIGLDAEKLAKIEAAARNQYRGERGDCVRFFSKEAFGQHLKEVVLLSPPAPQAEEKVTKHKGWNVKAVVVHVSPEEAKERENAVMRIMADSIRRDRKEPGGGEGQ